MTAPASSTSPSPSSLLLFAPAQNPLPVRYPHPHKPRLLLPALVHRALHSALDGDAPSFSVQSTDASKGKGSAVIIPHPDVIVKQDEPVREDKSKGAGNGSSIVGSNAATTDAPSTTLAEEKGLSTGPEGLVGAQVESEITFKLHLVGGPSSSSSSSSSASPTPTAAEIATERSQWVFEALSVAAQYKGLSRVDTLLIGFKGVDYKGKKTAVSEFFGCGAEGIEGGSGVENVSKEVEEEVLATWTKVRQEMVAGGKLGDVKVGTLYLPLGVLRRLTDEAGKGQQGQAGGANGQDAGRRGPVINMLDTPDCHSLPKEYTAYAKEQDIALWAGGGGEGADPLPDADLHNVLHEFQPLVSSSILSNQVPTGLDKLIPLREDELKYETEPKPALAVKWALGYTVISKSRNVVKDKG